MKAWNGSGSGGGFDQNASESDLSKLASEDGSNTPNSNTPQNLPEPRIGLLKASLSAM
jgi:hypothetical protein